MREYHVPAALVAFGTALTGFLLAVLFYGGAMAQSARRRRRMFRPVYRFLWQQMVFRRVVQRRCSCSRCCLSSRRVAEFDRQVIDRLIDGPGACGAWMCLTFDELIDR